MNTLITRIIFPNHWKIILIISCLKQRKCQYAYLNANIIRCLIWKKLSFKSNHLIFHLIWDFEDFWPDMTSYFMYLVICPALYVNFMWICHVNVLESGSLPFNGISWPCFASICPPPTLHTLVQYWKTRTISATYQRVFQNFTSVRTTVPRYFLAVVSFRQIPRKLCGIMIL